jgi:hypothetical protein
MLNLRSSIVPEPARCAAPANAWLRAPFRQCRSARERPATRRLRTHPDARCALGAAAATSLRPSPLRAARNRELLRRDVANAAESLTYARTEHAVSGEGGPPRAIAVGLLFIAMDGGRSRPSVAFAALGLLPVVYAEMQGIFRRSHGRRPLSAIQAFAAAKRRSCVKGSHAGSLR